ncbi:MAG TPA: glycosyl hydrolase 53 family protein [Bacteroidia bacterium]|nr:glycosyl hydrolase 53 family protein [Bacteroidia bacterium]
MTFKSNTRLFLWTLMFVLFILSQFIIVKASNPPNRKNRYKLVRPDFIRGINGHPLNQQAYLNMPVAQQIDLLKKLNFNYYRFDIPIDNNGDIKNKDTFFKLASIAKSNNIGLLPMIYLMGLNFNDNIQQSFQKGYTIGYRFARQYGNYFDYFELGNEEDLLVAKKGVSGSSPEDYDLNKLKTLASFLKGMIKGIKLQRPRAKIIINCAGWFHYVFLGLLDNEGVNYDVIGYHWYSDMDDYSKTVNVDILKVLTQKFKKPVLFTEINMLNGTNNNGEQKRDDWIRNFSSSCSKYQNVRGVFIYELLDEPNLPVASAGEKSFGIIKWDFQQKKYKDLNNTVSLF